ncbi:MAG TPA: hypothetical protein VGX49_17200 [Jatrophihabitans sp.]|jgi:hypothetical protein|nr:hypothetical protein [Jatrophihabitans sp.]
MTGSADQAASEPPPATAEQYRVADLEILRAGADLALVHARDSGAAGFYRADVVDLLVSCRQFGTLEQHLQAYLGNDAASVRRPGLQRELQRLLRAGFLVSLSGPQPAEPPHELPPISTLGFPTRDRVTVLHRALTSYAANCLDAGRRVEVVVVDDSADPGTRRAYRRMLGQLQSSLGLDLHYGGLEEKSAFVAALAGTGDLPEEVVRFGVLGEGAAGATIGANRNALLLHSAGERIFSADDDTVCRLAVPPEQLAGVELDSGGNPLQLWFFGGRDEAFGSVRYAEQDLLGLHERYLGQPPAPLLAAGPASFERADPALLRRLRHRPGTIRVTTNGTVGDCGWDNPDFHLFQDGASLARLVGTEAGYQLARTTRSMVQAATRTTISGRPDPKFAICLGLDNTELLPPFPPAGRAEEVGFGAVLASCFPDAYAAHLPWLVQHDPIDERHFSAANPFTIGLGSWLPSCLSRFDPWPADAPAERLRRLGEYLTDLAGLPGTEFDEFVRLGMFESMSGLILGLEERLAGCDPVPDYWARDVQRYLAQARRSALAPVDELYSALGGRAALQRLLRRYGQLLIWWPAIVGAARQLRAADHPLARPVREFG